MKSKTSSPKNSISPEEAIEFIESFQLMLQDQDEATVAISLRIPTNILRTLKTTAKFQGKKYQSLLIEYIRNGLEKDHTKKRL